jgi:hypothetical protein
MQSIIGKTVTGVTFSNYKDGELDYLCVKFDDGTELALTNDYIEGFGWSVFGAELRHPLSLLESTQPTEAEHPHNTVCEL